MDELKQQLSSYAASELWFAGSAGRALTFIELWESGHMSSETLLESLNTITIEQNVFAEHSEFEGKLLFNNVLSLVIEKLKL